MLTGNQVELSILSKVREYPHLEHFTLDAFISLAYIPHCKAFKSSWRVDETITLRHISPYFGSRKISSINRGEVESWINELLCKGLSVTTTNRILAVFKSVYALAVRYGVISTDQLACVDISFLKIPVNSERFISPENIFLILQTLEKSDDLQAYALRLLMLTGARKGEILNARWNDVNFELHMLVIAQPMSQKAKLVPLSDKAMAVISSIPRLSGIPWLFPGRNPEKPLNDLFRYWNIIRTQLGLGHVRIDDLRRKYVSMILNSRKMVNSNINLYNHDEKYNIFSKINNIIL